NDFVHRVTGGAIRVENGDAQQWKQGKQHASTHEYFSLISDEPCRRRRRSRIRGKGGEGEGQGKRWADRRSSLAEPLSKPKAQPNHRALHIYGAYAHEVVASKQLEMIFHDADCRPAMNYTRGADVPCVE